MRQGNKRFCLKAEQSPTHVNLCRFLQEKGWRPTRYPWRASLTESLLAFDEAAANCLEYKHLLAELLADCSENPMPLTYCIDDDNWPVLLPFLASQSGVNQAWILKPSLLNNGQHIHLFASLPQVAQHFLNPKRMGGQHVLQQYIANPHLLRDNRKYSIRMFVVLTDYAGIYLYQDGYFNVACTPYQGDDYSDYRSHLTNEHLVAGEQNVIQIPSARFGFFASFYPQIKSILALVMSRLQTRFPPAFQCGDQRKIALFGVDFLADDTGRIWLLEANHGPCFPVDDAHPLAKHLYHDFWRGLVGSLILPDAIVPIAVGFEKIG